MEYLRHYETKIWDEWLLKRKEDVQYKVIEDLKHLQSLQNGVTERNGEKRDKIQVRPSRNINPKY